MHIEKIQNNDYNTRFSAKLKIFGHVSDIDKGTALLWKQKAEKIGTDKDFISLRFGTFMTEKGCNFEAKKFKNWIASIRAIYGSAIINNEKIYKNKYIGYRVVNKPHSNELRNNLVSDFLDKCKRISGV